MSLNEQQLAVVNSTANKILCLAGAGAGKTYTMIERIKFLVSNNVSPTSILVLTFTNAAAAEMKCRYMRENTNQVSTPEFRTFHSFCYNLICTDAVVREKLGYREIPSIIDEVSEKRIRLEILSELSLKIPVGVLEGKTPPSPKQRQALELYDRQFRKYLHKSAQITFDILCYDICELFKKSDISIFPYKVHYKYIFVDEFQDTDPKQWEFVKSFKSSDIFVTGDVSQSLYGFRGADSTIIKSLAKSPEWTTYRLDHNYRSTKQICNFANRISKRYADESTYLKMLSDKDGVRVNVIEYDNIEECYKKLCKRLKSLSGTTAILARTNSEVYNIGKFLEEQDIPFNTNTSDKHVQYILSSILDIGFYADFLASLMDTETYLKYIKLRQLNKPMNIVEFILDNFASNYMKYVNKQVEDIRDYLTNGLNRGESPIKLCIGIIKRFRSNYSGTPMVGNTRTSIINMAIDELSQLSKTENSLYVGTIHSVKGLEYDNVIVTGVGDKSFAIKDEEQNNVYYVACTRPKQKLFVYTLKTYGLEHIFNQILNKIGEYEYEDISDTI